jgi:hypothetical protein
MSAAPRLLIAVGEPADSATALPPAIRSLIDAAGEVMVTSPALPSRLEWLMSDTDKAVARADDRLGVVVGQLEAVGTPARGSVGSDDPLVAFEDAIREFEPDHLLVALRPGEQAGWQERNLSHEVLARFGLPVTFFVVERI